MSIKEFRGEYRFLSNFFEAPIMYDGIVYRNNEAAFQAQKTMDLETRKLFATYEPVQAKREGRRIKLRPDWETVKVDIMKDIVTAKFMQNLELRDMLLRTGVHHIEEGNCHGDRFWGTVNGEGLNILGKILMETRDKFLLPYWHDPIIQYNGALTIGAFTDFIKECAKDKIFTDYAGLRWNVFCAEELFKLFEPDDSLSPIIFTNRKKNSFTYNARHNNSYSFISTKFTDKPHNVTAYVYPQLDHDIPCYRHTILLKV